MIPNLQNFVHTYSKIGNCKNPFQKILSKSIYVPWCILGSPITPLKMNFLDVSKLLQNIPMMQGWQQSNKSSLPQIIQLFLQPDGKSIHWKKMYISLIVSDYHIISWHIIRFTFFLFCLEKNTTKMFFFLFVFITSLSLLTMFPFNYFKHNKISSKHC